LAGQLSPEPIKVRTARGPAEVLVDPPVGQPVSVLALGHSAGGDIHAADLVAVRDAAVAGGVAVARIRQPYRVAGRRAPAPAGHLDEAWQAVLADVRSTSPYGELPLVVGGRSSGARVACRTAVPLEAVGVLALAFPLHPPSNPDRSRADELKTGLPTLVVNGDADPFGVPDPGPGRQVRVIPGADHSLRRDLSGLAATVLDWLVEHGWATARSGA
jgi:predicted alpha/beta-hydrolase family hydrolase